MRGIFTILTLSFLLVLTSFELSAKGYLMVAGGGGEAAGGWSDAPYRWVVEKTSNKRIAVITYDNTATQWIPNYFVSLGAKSAKNFIINSRSAANSQVLYDSLITYSGVFIKGGDQWKYYDYYKGTKVQDALQHIYDKGGVISGTSAGAAIISPIVYTAEIASVDPATALLNAYTSQITLKNDFLQTLPERYIYDTHFIERGRFGRLPAFMATWYKTKNEIATGIGVDDHTALCIDTTGNAKIFGTGAVGFFQSFDTNKPFDTSVEMLKSGNIRFTQLLHGCSINLKTWKTEGLTEKIKPVLKEENVNYRLLFSGTDYPSDDAFEYFVNKTGKKADTITIVTGSDLSRATAIKTKLVELNAAEVLIVQAISANINDPVTASNIKKAKKLVLVTNTYSLLMDFLKTGSNGKLLMNKIENTSTVTFFVGDNARFAGKTVVEKYRTSTDASYKGNLEFLPGLALLKTTAIIPNTFISSDFYENSVSGLPYGMVSDSLKYGFYITGNTFAVYGAANSGRTFFTNISGNFPLMSLINNGEKAGLANQGPYPSSRNVAGFENWNLRFMGINDTVFVGNSIISGVKNQQSADFNIYPNPANNRLFVQAIPGKYDFQIIDFSGKKMIESSFNNSTEINISDLKNGLYVVVLQNKNTKVKHSNKFQVIK